MAALEGRLDVFGIQDVLQLLELSQKTGVLIARSERIGDEARVQLDRGAIVFAVSRRSVGQLGKRLVDSRRLTEAELERALLRQREDPSRRLGQILLELGYLNGDELRELVMRQVEDTVFGLMTWEEGRFRFVADAGAAGSEGEIRVRVDSLLMEGARRLDEWARIRDRIGGMEAVPVLASADGLREPLELRAKEWRVLAEIDGRRDLSETAVELGWSGLAVARAVHGLMERGIVQIEQPRQVEDQ